MPDYNYHNARSSRESIVLRHYAQGIFLSIDSSVSPISIGVGLPPPALPAGEAPLVLTVRMYKNLKDCLVLFYHHHPPPPPPPPPPHHHHHLSYYTQINTLIV